MKILIPLSAVLVLASCTQTDQTKESSTKPPDVSRQQGMDSPITVSDGSTYLRHPAFTVKNEQNPDDSNNYDIHAHVSDSGFTAYKITCTSGCSATNRTALTAPWKVELWDDVKHSGHKYGMIKSADSMDVKTHFFNNPIQVIPDGTTPGQTDVVQNTYALRSAVLNNGGSPVYFVCDQADGSSVRCTITIDYCDQPTAVGCK